MGKQRGSNGRTTDENNERRHALLVQASWVGGTVSNEVGKKGTEEKNHLTQRPQRPEGAQRSQRQREEGTRRGLPRQGKG